MDRSSLLGYAGLTPVPVAHYRPGNVFGGGDIVVAAAWMMGLAFYSALVVLEDRDRKLKQREDTLVAAAESADTPEKVLEALEASADERAAIGAERERISGQLAAERARRDREQSAATIDESTMARAADAAAKADDNPPTPFASLGDQLMAVQNAAVAQKNGGAIDPRLTQIQQWWSGSVKAATGASSTVGSDGGFLVQTDLSNELLGDIIDAGQLANLTSPREIGAGFNGVKFNVFDETSRATGSRYGGVRAYWVAEGGQKIASRPKMRQVELTLQKMAALYVATDELLEDAVALESFVRPAFVEEMAFVLDDSLIRGTGAGMPLGILNADALVTVSKESGQAADTLVLENVDKMLVRLIPSSVPRAGWFINQELWPQLFQLVQVIGTGGVPVYQPPGQVQDSPFGRLRGRPVTVIEQASAPGDLGDIILADWKQYILIRKGGIRQAASIHVYFDTDETAFRWVLRVNGRPVRHSSVTPYKGSGTLSSFVTLQAR